MKITRLNEAVTTDNIKVAVGTKAPMQIRKALVGNVCAASLLLVIGDEATAKELQGANRYTYSSLASSVPRVTYWATVCEHLKGLAATNPDYMPVYKDWANLTNSVVRAIYGNLAKGFDADVDEIINALRQFSHSMDLSSDRRVLNIRAAMLAWDKLDKIDRNRAVSSAWQLLIEGDPDSPYLSRLRSQSIMDIIKVPFSFRSMIKKIVREDGGEGPGVAANIPTNAPAQPGTGTTSQNISPMPYSIFKGKIIKRMKKNFFPKFIKRQQSEKIYRIFK